MPQLHHNSRPVRSIVARNTLFQIIGRFFSAVSTLILTVYIARSFGASGYGDFVKITTFVSFFYLIADFGLNAMYLQKSHEYDGENHGVDRDWSTLIGLRFIVSCVLMICVFVLVFLIPRGGSQGYTPAVRFGILLLAPTIFFQACITSFNGLFQKYLRYDNAMYAVTLGSAVMVVLICLSAVGVFPLTISGVISIVSIGSAVTALTGLYFSRKFIRLTPISLSMSAYRSLFVAGIPLGLTLIFNVIYFHVDSVILTVFRPTAEVGIYGLAYKVFELPLVFPTFFMNAMYPLLLSAGQTGQRIDMGQFKHLLGKSAVALGISSLMLTVVLWTGAPFVVYIKRDFLQSVTALRILSLGLPFFFLSSLMMWALIARKKQLTLMIIYGISMVMNIVLNSVFVPVYGFTAAAWITVASEALVLIGTSGAVWRVVYNQ